MEPIEESGEGSHQQRLTRLWSVDKRRRPEFPSDFQIVW